MNGPWDLARGGEWVGKEACLGIGQCTLRPEHTSYISIHHTFYTQPWTNRPGRNSYQAVEHVRVVWNIQQGHGLERFH